MGGKSIKARHPTIEPIRTKGIRNKSRSKSMNSLFPFLEFLIFKTKIKLVIATKSPDILIVDKESFAKYPKIIIITGKVTPFAVTPTEKETIFMIIIKRIPKKIETVMLEYKGARLHLLELMSQM
jgi:hypothetical protein